jgi:hypothetical protein
VSPLSPSETVETEMASEEAIQYFGIALLALFSLISNDFA